MDIFIKSDSEHEFVSSDHPLEKTQKHVLHERIQNFQKTNKISINSKRIANESIINIYYNLRS